MKSPLRAEPFSPEVEELIARARNRLMDYPELYRMSEEKEKWSDDNIYYYLLDARDDININPPKTHFSLEEMYREGWGNALVTGVLVFGVFGRAILETEEQFQYSDNGLSLNLNKGPQYQALAQALLGLYMDEKEMVKRTVRPKGRGLLSSRTQFPVRINRIMRHNTQFGGRF